MTAQTSVRNDWRERAACRNADVDLFFPEMPTTGLDTVDPKIEMPMAGLGTADAPRRTDEESDEPQYPPPAVYEYCDRCDVRPECLATALSDPTTVGIWAGTTTYQRKRLKRKRSRQRCPGCRSRNIADMDQGGEVHELCLSCGLSWRAKGQGE